MDDFKSELIKLESVENVLTKRLLFVGMLTRALEPDGVTPVLIGGNAVEYYTAGGYATGDIDIIAPHEPVDKVLKGWGFKKEGRYWWSEALNIVIEAPSSYLDAEQKERLIEVEIDSYSVFLLGVEDLILDRLNAYVYWNSKDDGLWAKELLVLYKDDIDWSYLESRAGKESVLKALHEMRQEI